MLTEVRLIDEMDEYTCNGLRQNLTGITEGELDWRQHPKSNSIRWIIGHLTWVDQWAVDLINGEGLYLAERVPQTYEPHPLPVLRERFEAAHARYRDRIATLTEPDLARTVSWFRRSEVTILHMLKHLVLQLAGHRYQIRYIRGTYSREHGTRKVEFDPG